MKRLFLILLFSIQLLTVLAYDFKYKNVFYNLDKENKTAYVTYEQEIYDNGRTDYTGNITIADKIEVNGETYIVNAIGNFAFAECIDLLSVKIPTNIEVIGNNAFAGCISLEEFTLPNSLKYIGEQAFAFCNTIKTIILPNQVISIGAQAFNQCLSLTSLFIPNMVTDIDYDAFYDCKSLKNVYISDLAAWCNINFSSMFSNPLFYAQNLILRNKVLNNVSIPQTVTEIKPYTFLGCKCITSLNIENSVISIGEMAFYNCPNLQNINISSSVDLIDYQAFKFCSHKDCTINIYNPDTKIGEGAFDFCSGTLHVMKDYKNRYQQNEYWEDLNIIDDLPTFCATPVITYTDGQLHIVSETPGATCHLMRTIGKVAQGEKISNLPISAYATAEGYQPSKVATVWLNDLIK